MVGRRFALYFAPENGSVLDEFGWRWLGRRPDSAELGPLPAVGLDPDRQAGLVADARRYGFHATLKAPFRLGEGMDDASLRDAAAAFARQRRPFVEPPFVLKDLHGFLALRPRQPSAALDELAGDCVRAFDRFRAPSTTAERQKRLAAPLTDRQKELLDTWGYPYVFDQFRFHLTMTRPLHDDERAGVRNLLERLSAPVLREPVEVRSLCLFEQAAPGTPFVLAARFPFGG
ncbi:MAG TPA: DUF1045 domain-containing protein [Azospirillum sp.]|nr:DUF1045 domain-containing protein [Azospirillum sp.]